MNRDRNEQSNTFIDWSYNNNIRCELRHLTPWKLLTSFPIIFLSFISVQPFIYIGLSFWNLDAATCCIFYFIFWSFFLPSFNWIILKWNVFKFSVRLMWRAVVVSASYSICFLFLNLCIIVTSQSQSQSHRHLISVCFFSSSSSLFSRHPTNENT